jgi:hypothetical protein
MFNALPFGPDAWGLIANIDINPLSPMILQSRIQ